MQRIEKKMRSDTLHFNDIPVLKYTIEYPTFRSTCNQRAVDTINEYYTSLAKRKEQYCRQFLYPQAVEAARYIQENTPPFNYYEFYMTYKITWNKGCITSLYIDEYTYLGGAHGSTIRTSDTWDFSVGRRLYLKDLYPKEHMLKDKVQKTIEGQIIEQLKTSPQSYFDDYAKLVAKTLNLNSFYLTQDGVVLYFQQYDIAPYAAGFPEFSFGIIDIDT